MVRKTALVTAMLGAFVSQSFAMGLGEIRLNSVLNQPLNAEIQLLSPTPSDLVALRVALASPAAYKRAGVERAFFHTKLRFEVVSRPDGSAFIKVTSREPVREPYLDFLIEATWGSGQVLREYTMLVDPPAMMPAPAPVTRAPSTSAPRTAPAAAGKPELPIPAPPQYQNQYQKQGSFSGSEYTTSRNDTLWQIAEQVRPDGTVSIEQTMLGLLEVNPSAFYDQNINNLKAGHVLRVPSAAELSAISQREAQAEVRRQNRLWRDGRRAGSDSAAQGSQAAAASGGAQTDSGAQLKLVAPDAEELGAAGVSINEAKQLRSELTMALEAAEAQRQENQDLNTRVQELEGQLAKLHRLIELKDSELARLGADPGALAEAPPLAAPSTPAEPASAEALTGDSGSPDETNVSEMPPAVSESGEAMVPETVEAENVAPVEPPAPAPLPAEPVPTPAPVAAEPEGLVDNILSNPLLKWGALGGGLLVAVLAWLGLRRRAGQDSEFQESILAVTTNKAVAASRAAAPAAAAAGDDATVLPSAAALAPEPSAKADKAASQTDSSLFTDFAVSDMGAMQGEDEADPIAEADVYLAYGRYQQAEELMRGAIARLPERNDLKVKLLEVLFAAKNGAAFDSEAEALLANLEGQDAEMWPRVAEMGQELNPSNPLYKANDAASAAASVTAAAAAPASMPTPEPAMAQEAEGDVFAETVANLDVDASPETAQDNSIEFDLGEFESFAKQASEPGVAQPSEEELDLDLSALDEEVYAEEGTLATSDEVATKIDLARAYMEMGDPDGARSILEEVMEEGSDAQKTEAQTLLQKVS